MKCIATLREKSNDQLKNRLTEITISLRRAVGKTKAGGVITRGQTIDSMFIHKLKKEKARILTILRERELKHQPP